MATIDYQQRILATVDAGGKLVKILNDRGEQLGNALVGCVMDSTTCQARKNLMCSATIQVLSADFRAHAEYFPNVFCGKDKGVLELIDKPLLRQPTIEEL